MQTKRIAWIAASGFSLGLVLAVAQAPATYAASNPAQKCAATKLKAAGKKAKAKMKCYAKAASTSAAGVAPDCLTKAEQKFSDAFTKAESKGGCVTVGDDAAIEQMVDNFVADVAAQLPSGVLPAAHKCAATKLKAAGKKAAAKMKCYAKAASTGAAGVAPDCLTKAEQKFSDAFAKAESKGGCVPVGDDATIEQMVDDFVADVTAQLPSGALPTPTPTPISGASCSNMVKDGTETDVDCGGSSCLPCKSSQSCSVGTDCYTGVCSGGTCGCDPGLDFCDTGCTNLQQNPFACGACGNICLSGQCSSGTCLPPPPTPSVSPSASASASSGPAATPTPTPYGGASCGNMVRDGAETDVDCGGGTCSPCYDGASCLVGNDCQSGYCPAGSCTLAPPTCSDNMQNGNETYADCGGGTCPPCKPDVSCLVDDDCLSGICLTNMLCQ